MSEDALKHIEQFPCTISTVELQRGVGTVTFMLLSGDRLFYQSGKLLCVYSVSEITSSLATYDLVDRCNSGLIADSRLFLDGGISNKIIVYEMQISLSDPLKKVASIETKNYIRKMIKLGQELVLGEVDGYLQVFDIANYKITHTQTFAQNISPINEMIAIE